MTTTRKSHKPERLIYANPKQGEFFAARAQRKVFLAGRGSGKTHTEGFCAYDYVQRMPRSKGALVGATLTDIKEKFLPVIDSVFDSIGLVEDVHYVMFTAPPNHWPKAYMPPKHYRNCITFCNGSVIMLVNWKGKTAARGSSFDWMLIDEAFLCPKSFHDRDLMPTLRGNAFRYTDKQGHFEVCYFTSQPRLESQKWIFDMEGKEGTYWVESNAYDNIHAYGAAQLEFLLSTLPPSEARIEILNERIGTLSNSFYHALNLDTHTYLEPLRIGKRIDNHYNLEEELHVSWDFGGKITCCVILQRSVQEGITIDRVMDEIYRKKGDGSNVSLLDQVIEDFIEKYRGHKGTLQIWGDRNGNNSMANSNATFYDVITTKLRAAGFKVNLTVKGLDVLHTKKHYIINGLLAGHSPKNVVLINRKNCPNLIISMSAAPITEDFKKDKSSERLATIPQERATHLSDCFDNYFAKVGERVVMGKLSVDLRPMIAGR